MRGDLPRPRNLHPAAWWLWALALGVAATRTTNPLLHALLIATSAYVVVTCRPDAPWSRSYSAFVKLALAVLLIRLVFAVTLGSPSPAPMSSSPSPKSRSPTGRRASGSVARSPARRFSSRSTTD